MPLTDLAAFETIQRSGGGLLWHVASNCKSQVNLHLQLNRPFHIIVDLCIKHHGNESVTIAIDDLDEYFGVGLARQTNFFTTVNGSKIYTFPISILPMRY